VTPVKRYLEAPKPCPECGIEYMEFRRTGKLGCAGDYTAFRAELAVILERLQQGRVHSGKRPTRGASGDFGEWRRLRRRMAEAVAARDYESAAVLRDELKLKDGVHGP
jgi:protein arginine kinase activator